MARPMKPLVRGGGYYPSNGWTPLVYAGGYTTANGGEEPAPPPIEKTVTGNPIHILDALAKPAQALSVKLEPIQDLNGYDNPWPAGGGKNKLKITATSSTINGITYTVNEDGTIVANGTASDASTFVLTKGRGIFDLGSELILNGSVGGFGNSVRLRFGASNPGVSYDDFGNGVTIPQISDISTRYVYVQITILSGTTVSNIVFKPMIRLASETDATFSPYSNICPISGWTGATVTRTGINVWDEEWEVGGIDIATGNNTTSPRVRSKNYITCVPSASYFWNLPVGSGLAVCYYDAGKNFISGAWEFEKRAKEAPINARYMKFSTGNAYGTTYKNDISINYPSTDTDYHAYQGETYTITFPTSAGTVYGGTLDVTQGKLTVDRAMLGNVTWTKHSSYSHVFYAQSGIGQLVNSTGVSNACVLYSGGNLASFASDSEYRFRISDRIYINIPSVSNVTELETWITNNSLQICFELATPIVYDLTPTEVTLLLGENNLWSDGEMTLVYLADGNASDEEALGILLGGRYTPSDDVTDKEALGIILGGTE